MTEHIFIITGGSPCQDISMNHNTERERRADRLFHEGKITLNEYRSMVGLPMIHSADRKATERARGVVKLRKIKSIAWFFFTGLCWGITPYIFHLADLERGYNDTGGEILFPLIPIIIWFIADTAKETKATYTGAGSGKHFENSIKK